MIIQATGRRKTASAQIRLTPGSGVMSINRLSVDDFFQGHRRQKDEIYEPMKALKLTGTYDISITVRGGGITGQAGAIRLGISRALSLAQPDMRPVLRNAGLLTRDSRMVERKKPGQPKARKRFQFSKR